MRGLVVLFIDIVVLFASIWLGFTLLNSLNMLENYENNINSFYSIAAYLIPIYLIIGYVFGMLSLQRKSVSEVIYTVFIVSVAFTVSLMALIYLVRDIAAAFPRSVIVLSPLLYFPLLASWRVFVQKLYIRQHGRRGAIIIGESAQHIALVLKTRFKNLYEIKHVIDEQDAKLNQKLSEANDIFISDDVSLSLRDKLLLLNNDMPDINIYYLPRISDIPVINSKLFPFGDIPVHSVRKIYLNAEERFVKRAIDIVVSILLLVVSLPFFLFISLVIKIEGGSVFFTQKRLTRDRKVFSIIKFRTMTPDAEQETGPMLSTRKDKRITKIGKFLRASRLDELPQLWNVLKGEMSLVGPRPERPFFAEQIEKEIPEFKFRLNVKAGLTGQAQIMGKYNTDFKQKLHYDLYYINNFSIFRDFLIMLQTLKVILQRENGEGVR